MTRRKKFKPLTLKQRPNQFRSLQAVSVIESATRVISTSRETGNKYVPATSYNRVPYDESLLDRSRTQWQLGDWVSLTKLDGSVLLHHPERAKLALLAAVGHLQTNSPGVAGQFIRLAQDWGCSKTMVSQVLISGVYNGLGRAALMVGQNQRALSHFKTAAKTANQGVENPLWAETIALREGMRLGLLSQTTTFLGTTPTQKIANPPPKPPDNGITSYAQNFEDVMLWRALGRIQNGFYIDVGAQDPVVDSVSKAFYEHGWRGVHVEPIAAYAEALRRDRPDERVVEAVLAATPGTQGLFDVSSTGLSTASLKFAERHRQRGWQVTEITVSASTLAAVFDEEAPHDIHWLKVDVEGMEEAVFAGWGSQAARPWIIVVEATKPNSQTQTHQEWEHHLRARDYVFVYFDGLNRFYVHGAHSELKQSFQTPPNVFDGFTKYQRATAT